VDPSIRTVEEMRVWSEHNDEARFRRGEAPLLRGTSRSPGARALALLAVTCLRLGAQATQPSRRPEAPPAAPRSVAALVARLVSILDSSRVPGAGVAIVRHDSVLFAGGIGLAHRTPARAATARTLFRIGSTSKMFIGLTALVLEREGKLRLTDPVSRHLPELHIANPWEATDTVRLIHLLEHTSGLDDNSVKAYASSDPAPLSLADGLALDSASLRSRWRPGTRFAYSNTGPAIVARIIETIEDQPFEAIVQHRWFDRIGMTTATYFHPDPARADLATLYRNDRTTPVPYWHLFARPVGAINAAPTDMAALLRFLVGRGVVGADTILPPQLLDRAERASTWIGTRTGISDVGYGLTLYRTEGADGRIWTGHEGGVEGGLSDLSYLPEHGLGYALQINASSGGTLRVLAAAVREFLTSELPPVQRAPVAPMAPVMAKDFAGWYRPVSPRPQVISGIDRILNLEHVIIRDQKIEIDGVVGPTRWYVPVDSLLFRNVDGTVATLSFHRDSANGRPLAMDGLSSGTSYERISTATAMLTLGLVGLWMLAIVAGAIGGLVLGVAWLVRRFRQPRGHDVPTPTAAVPLWWLSCLASGLAFLYLTTLQAGFADVHELGTLTPLSAAFAASPVLFGLTVLLGLVSAVRGWGAGDTRRARLSAWGARTMLVLHAVTLAYIWRHGLLGWMPWT
jgi:CubicO group peptidase (beta-lactamase class C family)